MPLRGRIASVVTVVTNEVEAVVSSHWHKQYIHRHRLAELEGGGGGGSPLRRGFSIVGIRRASKEEDEDKECEMETETETEGYWWKKYDSFGEVWSSPATR